MRSIPAILVAVGIMAVTGCGGKDGPVTVRVSGTVSLEGKPLDEGKITLTPIGETQGGSVAGEIRDGKYDIPKSEGPLVNGNYRVEISAIAKQGKSLPNVVDPGGPSLAVFEELIPPAYNRDSTLTMKTSDDKSANTFDFSLTKAGK